MKNYNIKNWIAALVTISSLSSSAQVFSWDDFALNTSSTNSSVSGTTSGGVATVNSTSNVTLSAYQPDGANGLLSQASSSGGGSGQIVTEVTFDNFYATDLLYSVNGIRDFAIKLTIEAFDANGNTLTTNITPNISNPTVGGVATNGAVAMWNFNNNVDASSGFHQNLTIQSIGDVSKLIYTIEGDSSHVDGLFTTTDSYHFSDISAQSVTSVPEPSSTLLLGIASISLILRRKK